MNANELRLLNFSATLLQMSLTRCGGRCQRKRVALETVMRPVRSRPYKSSETLARSKAGTLIIPMYIFLSRLGRAHPRNLSPAIKSPESLRSSNTFRATTAPKQSSHLVVRPKTSSSHRTWSRLHNHPSKL